MKQVPFNQILNFKEGLNEVIKKQNFLVETAKLKPESYFSVLPSGNILNDIDFDDYFSHVLFEEEFEHTLWDRSSVGSTIRTENTPLHGLKSHGFENREIWGNDSFRVPGNIIRASMIENRSQPFNDIQDNFSCRHIVQDNGESKMKRNRYSKQQTLEALPADIYLEDSPTQLSNCIVNNNIFLGRFSKSSSKKKDIHIEPAFNIEGCVREEASEIASSRYSKAGQLPDLTNFSIESEDVEESHEKNCDNKSEEEVRIEHEIKEGGIIKKSKKKAKKKVNQKKNKKLKEGKDSEVIIKRKQIEVPNKAKPEENNDIQDKMKVQTIQLHKKIKEAPIDTNSSYESEDQSHVSDKESNQNSTKKKLTQEMPIKLNVVTPDKKDTPSTQMKRETTSMFTQKKISDYKTSQLIPEHLEKMKVNKESSITNNNILRDNINMIYDEGKRDVKPEVGKIFVKFPSEDPQTKKESKDTQRSDLKLKMLTKDQPEFEKSKKIMTTNIIKSCISIDKVTNTGNYFTQSTSKLLGSGFQNPHKSKNQTLSENINLVKEEKRASDTVNSRLISSISNFLKKTDSRNGSVEKKRPKKSSIDKTHQIELIPTSNQEVMQQLLKRTTKYIPNKGEMSSSSIKKSAILNSQLFVSELKIQNTQYSSKKSLKKKLSENNHSNHPSEPSEARACERSIFNETWNIENHTQHRLKDPRNYQSRLNLSMFPRKAETLYPKSSLGSEAYPSSKILASPNQKPTEDKSVRSKRSVGSSSNSRLLHKGSYRPGPPSYQKQDNSTSILMKHKDFIGKGNNKFDYGGTLPVTSNSKSIYEIKSAASEKEKPSKSRKAQYPMKNDHHKPFRKSSIETKGLTVSAFRQKLARESCKTEHHQQNSDKSSIHQAVHTIEPKGEKKGSKKSLAMENTKRSQLQQNINQKLESISLQVSPKANNISSKKKLKDSSHSKEVFTSNFLISDLNRKRNKYQQFIEYSAKPKSIGKF